MLPRVNVVKCDEADYLLFAAADVISRVLYHLGHWEPHLLTISRKLIEGVERPLIVDVGANVGAYSIPLAKGIEASGGQVVAFEPQRVVYYQLCGNVVLNRLDNYIALNQAVGDVDSEIAVPDINYASNHNIGAFSLDPQLRSLLQVEQYMKPKQSMVPLVRLDSLSWQQPPALIKIDVEGYELKVLRGAVALLEQYNYPPLLFEAWTEAWFDKERNELLAFVEYLGYAISFNGNADYVAQHPRCPVRVDFFPADNGNIHMVKVR